MKTDEPTDTATFSTTFSATSSTTSPTNLSIPKFNSIPATYVYNAAIDAAKPASNAVLFVYATSKAIN